MLLGEFPSHSHFKCIFKRNKPLLFYFDITECASLTALIEFHCPTTQVWHPVGFFLIQFSFKKKKNVYDHLLNFIAVGWYTISFLNTSPTETVASESFWQNFDCLVFSFKFNILILIQYSNALYFQVHISGCCSCASGNAFSLGMCGRVPR